MSENTTTPESIEQQVAAWSATDAAICETVAKTAGITVAGYIDEKGVENPKKGREAVQKALTSLVTVRTGIEARRKELKAPILALGTLVDNEAKRLTAISQPRELELEKDRDAYDAVEKKRIKDEKEIAKVKRQERINASVAVGIVPNLDQIDNATDEEWDTLIAEATAAQEAWKRAASISATLTALEDPCTPEEAAELTDAQAEHRIAVAQKAKNDRDEVERIKREEEAAEQKRIADEAEAKRVAEQAETDRKRNEEIEIERAARATLELGSRRSMELAALGSFVVMDECAEWSAEVFAAALKAATDAKVLRDEEARKQREQAEQQAAELRRMQEAEEARKKAYEDAQEDARKAQEAKDKAEREDAEQKAEAARLEAIKPDIEKARAWFEACKAAIPEIPEVTDSEIKSALHRARVTLILAIQGADFLPF